MTFPVRDIRNVVTAKSVEEVVARIREVFGDDVVSSLRERKGGSDGATQFYDLWLDLGDKERLLEMVDLLAEFDFPQFHIISGNDDGDVVTLYYHFTLFQAAGRGKRLGIAVEVPVDKSDLVVDSLYSRIPGVEYSERETREMFGVDFDGLPNKALVFLPEDWDEDVKPWRRDETGPTDKEVRELS